MNCNSSHQGLRNLLYMSCTVLSKMKTGEQFAINFASSKNLELYKTEYMSQFSFAHSLCIRKSFVMKLQYLIIINFVIVFARSANIQPDNRDFICSTPECQQLPQHRFEIIEMAIRTIVTALSSQKSDLFAPIKAILEQDLAVKSILLATSPTNTTASIGGIKNSVGNKPNNISTTQIITKGTYSESLQQGRNMVDNLKGVIKCSLAHLVDINAIDFESNPNNSSVFAASITSNDSLQITWPVLSTECLKFSSGVWIRVYEIGYEIKFPVETFLSIPQKCIKKNSENNYSIILLRSSSSGKKDACIFSLSRNLTQCRSYAVEVIQNFQSLRGNIFRKEIVIQPKLSDNPTSTVNVVVVNSNSLKLNWKDNSGCAPQMTSLNLQIFQDGIAGSDNKSNSSLRIPRSCLKQETNEDDVFSVVLPITNPQTMRQCSIEWKPLDRCRKYTLDMSSQYTETWNGLAISANIFTRGNEANFSIESDLLHVNSWMCPRKHFICNHGCASTEQGRIAAYICNGENNCYNGRDEQYCDQNICEHGFKCDRQCIPKERVCDGQHDCLDGSDENYDCIYADSCMHFTNSSGHFSSVTFPKPVNEIDSGRAARKVTVLISVQPNHQIWLAFEKCVTMEKQHFINIYDGPYSTSPLLLSYSGSVSPFSVRSSSNDLYMEFPSYYYPDYGITAFYTSMKSTDEPFVPDCGGYINGDGVISTPNYLTNTDMSADCYWFVEVRHNEDTILLSNFDFLSSTQGLAIYDDFDQTSMLPPTRHSSPIIVYDGWNSSGIVLYDNKMSDQEEGKSIYSISNKIMVHSHPSVVRGNFASSSWKISKISTPQCSQNFEDSNGTIKSPNYPLIYPNATDCRWSIKVEPTSKVVLLFAFFETQEGADFLYVYDGPTVYSNVLFKKSGSAKTPFRVNSTTNIVLVRFTSDDKISFPGFLVVYSAV